MTHYRLWDKAQTPLSMASPAFTDLLLSASPALLGQSPPPLSSRSPPAGVCSLFPLPFPGLLPLPGMPFLHFFHPLHSLQNSTLALPHLGCFHDPSPTKNRMFLLPVLQCWVLSHDVMICFLVCPSQGPDSWNVVFCSSLYLIYLIWAQWVFLELILCLTKHALSQKHIYNQHHIFGQSCDQWR